MTTNRVLGLQVLVLVGAHSGGGLSFPAGMSEPRLSRFHVPREPPLHPINIREAKTHLSRWVEAIVQGDERESQIARTGRPIAKLEPVRASAPDRCIGLARGYSRFRTTSMPAMMMRWLASFSARAVHDPPARYPCGPVGNRRRPQSLSTGPRADPFLRRQEDMDQLG